MHFTANSEPKTVNVDDIIELLKKSCSPYGMVKKSLIFNFGDSFWLVYLFFILETNSKIISIFHN